MMRALGPGSVSSILKIGLDVFNVLLWVVLAITIILVFTVLIAQPFLASQVTVEGGDNAARVRAVLRSPLIPALFAVAALYVGGLVFIVGRLRRVFATLTQGDPFRPENVRRLRLIGFMLGGLELLSYLVRAAVRWAERTQVAENLELQSGGQGFNPTIWFAVLVVFVLAEVFREGARLRREAELTI